MKNIKEFIIFIVLACTLIGITIYNAYSIVKLNKAYDATEFAAIEKENKELKEHFIKYDALSEDINILSVRQQNFEESIVEKEKNRLEIKLKDIENYKNYKKTYCGDETPPCFMGTSFLHKSRPHASDYHYRYINNKEIYICEDCYYTLMKKVIVNE